MLKRPRRSLVGKVRVSIATAMAMASVATLATEMAHAQTPQKAGAVSAAAQYGKLPLGFEANQGQTDKRVRYVARGNGFNLYLTKQEAVLSLRSKKVSADGSAAGGAATKRLTANGIALPASAYGPVRTPRPGAPLKGSPDRPFERGPILPQPSRQETATDVLRLQLQGTNPNAEPQGADRLPGDANYILGNDPAKWHTGVPVYGQVRYAGVYPGIDLVYYGNEKQLEYDFVVAAHASARAIQMHFDGASALKLEKNGDLTIAAKDGSVVFQKPTVYQVEGGAHRRVDGNFKMLAGNTVGFVLGRYDHSKPVVIDPVLLYSTFLGGSAAEYVVAVAADASGDAYVTGLTISEDFPLTAGAFQAINYASGANAVSTAFVTKLNPSGTAELYSTYLGGLAISDTLHEQGDYGKAIAVDGSGNAYVTGYTYSTNFPVTGGAFQTVDQAADIALATGFVTKLNPSGTGLVYSTFLGGDLLDEPSGIAIDAQGDAYIGGLTFSANFPTTAGAFQTTNKSSATNGYNDFVTKLNPSGSALIYSTFLGGASSNGSSLGGLYWTNPVAVDSSGNAYAIGFTNSGNFPVTANAYQKTSSGGLGITLSKLNPSGSALVYSTYVGGSTIAISEGLAIDSAGNAYVAGYTSDTDFPVTAGAFQTTNKADTNTSTSGDANQNGFLFKMNPTGTALVYSTYLGGTTGPWGGDQIYELALDSAGDAYVAGAAMSADFPVTSNAYQSTNHGATSCCVESTYTSNGFLTEFNPQGTALIYSTYFGGQGTQNPDGPGGFGDGAYGLALGSNGSVFLVGYTTSGTFPVTSGAFETKYHTEQNTGFVAAFDFGAAPTNHNSTTTLTASANPVTPGTAVTFTATVAPATGTGTPTGNVVFSVDEATVATVALSGGKATYTATGLAPGEHYVLASYTGNSTYGTSGDGFNEDVVPVTPVITPAAGTYESEQTVTITCTTAGAAIYYTLDGTTPTVFSHLYTGPINLLYSTTVKAIAVAMHDAVSAVATSVIDVIGSPVVLSGPATAIATPSATLNAYINSLGLSGTYSFRYGTSSTTLSSMTAATNLAAVMTRVQATATLTGLASKTTYYYQVVATTAGGVTTGPVLSFTTN